MTNALQRRFIFAQDVAVRAAALARSMQPPPGASTAALKSAQDWLTEADGAIERFLSDALLDAFPDDGFEGEEGGIARAGALRWVVDPIDGTSNFARGGSRWCVSLGLIDGAVAVAGVLIAPCLGEHFAAMAGAGATLNGAPIHAAATSDLGRAIVEVGWSPRRPNEDWLALCRRVMATGATVRTGGSGALGLADVAAGRQDAYAELHINLWDVAASLCILKEAGATIFPFPTSREGAPMLATAPALAAALDDATRLFR